MKKKKNEIEYPTLVKTQNKYKKKLSVVDSLTTLFYTLKAIEENKSFLEKFKNKLIIKRKIKEEKPAVPSDVVRFETDVVTGLNNEQIEQRKKANLINKTKVKSSKSYGAIFAKNIFTFFNMLWAIIAFLLKIPNTISHTLLGGLIGAAMVAFGVNSVLWTDYVLLNVVAMVLLAPLVGFILGFIMMRVIKKVAIHATRSVSNVLTVLQRLNLIVLAGAFSSNNSQKALGVILLLGALGLASYSPESLPVWVVIVVSAALTAGMLFGGIRVINTVGRKIYKVGPIHSVVSQLTTSVVSLVGTGLGISLGMGQVMTGSVMGVGAAERMRGVHWTTAGKIVFGWCMTLPVSGGCSALMYVIVKAIMGI